MITELRFALAAAVLSSAAASAFAQGHAGHGGHMSPPQAAPAPGGHGDHKGHGGAASPTAEDSWAYTDRDNPKPVSRNRWVMVPGESGAMYRSGKDMTPDQRCRALLGSPRIIVDAATRAACGDAAAPPPAAPAHSDHPQHR